MKKYKYPIMFLNIACIIFLQCGCWDKTEIDRLAIIKAISISESKNSKELIVSVDIANYENSSNNYDNLGSGNSKLNKETVITARGKTFLEALNNIQARYNKKLIFSHNKVFIIDKKYAKRGITNILDSLERTNILSYYTYTLVSADSPIKVLNSKDNSEEKQISAIEMLIRLNSDTAINYPVKWYMFLRNLKSDTGVATTPQIKINKKSQMLSNTTAVFKNDKMVGVLSSEQTKTFQWFLNNVNEQNLDLPFKNNKKNSIISFRLLEGNCTINAIKSIKSKYGLKINIVCNGIASLRGCTGSTLQPLDKDFINKIGTQANFYFKKNFISLIEFAKKSLNADIFGFGNEINSTMPITWQHLRRNWKSEFKNVEYDVQFNIKFKDIGTIKDTIVN